MPDKPHKSPNPTNLTNPNVINKTQTVQGSFKFSLRLSPRELSSISINTKLIALWVLIRLLTETETENNIPNIPFIQRISSPNSKILDKDKLKGVVSNFAHSNTKNWNLINRRRGSKGLSDYISTCFYFDICARLGITKEDYIEFFELVTLTLKEN